MRADYICSECAAVTIEDIAGGHRQLDLLRAAVDRSGLLPLADRRRREVAFPQDDLLLKVEHLEMLRDKIVDLSKQYDAVPNGKRVFGRGWTDGRRKRYPSALVQSTLRRVNRTIMDMRA